MRKVEIRQMCELIANGAANHAVTDAIDQMEMGMNYLSEMRGELLKLRNEFFDKIDEVELRMDLLESKIEKLQKEK